MEVMLRGGRALAKGPMDDEVHRRWGRGDEVDALQA